MCMVWGVGNLCGGTPAGWENQIMPAHFDVQGGGCGGGVVYLVVECVQSRAGKIWGAKWEGWVVGYV